MILDKIEVYVERALEENKKARQNDFILYGAVLKRMGVDINLSLAELFANSKKYNLPAMESVSRLRRIVQEHRPELIHEHTQVFRQERINEIVKFVRNY